MTEHGGLGPGSLQKGPMGPGGLECVWNSGTLPLRGEAFCSEHLGYFLLLCCYSADMETEAQSRGSCSEWPTEPPQSWNTSPWPPSLSHPQVSQAQGDSVSQSAFGTPALSDLGLTFPPWFCACLPVILLLGLENSTPRSLATTPALDINMQLISHTCDPKSSEIPRESLFPKGLDRKSVV